MLRRRINSSASAEVRRARRFFFRPSVSTTVPSTGSETQPENHRRSFLAKPPAPGAARRVLAVLNSQKRSSSRRAPPSTQQQDYQSEVHPEAVLTRQQLSTARHRTKLRSYNHGDAAVKEKPTHWSKESSTILRKTHVPSRPVKPLDDLPVQELGGRTDSPISSIQSSRGTVAPRSSHPVALLDVDASELSDEVNSTTDPKSRSALSASTASAPIADTEPVHPVRRLMFPDDHVCAERTCHISQGSTRPPSRLQSWPPLEDRIRELQNVVDRLHHEKNTLNASNTDLELRNNELSVLVDSMRTRTSESTAEVAELTRHLKETRKRLTRRIRELEEELADKDRHSDANANAKYQAALDSQLFDGLSNASTQQILRRKASVPSIPTRRQRASTPITLAIPQVDIGVRPLASDSMLSHSTQGKQFARVRSAGTVYEQARRRSIRSDASTLHRPATPNRNALIAKSNNANPSTRTLARRSLIRRAFIAHIHSQRYRDPRDAWLNFLTGEAGTVTPEQFARAVRGLAVAADARGKDLDLLRKEVSGAEVGDTGGMTITMFAEFYERTKNEPT